MSTKLFQSTRRIGEPVQVRGQVATPFRFRPIASDGPIPQRNKTPLNAPSAEHFSHLAAEQKAKKKGRRKNAP
jgi:hypothetical protein